METEVRTTITALAGSAALMTLSALAAPLAPARSNAVEPWLRFAHRAGSARMRLGLAVRPLVRRWATGIGGADIRTDDFAQPRDHALVLDPTRRSDLAPYRRLRYSGLADWIRDRIPERGERRHQR